MVESFSDVADFALVYISEAHPAETKHFGGNYEITTHLDMKDRLSAARFLSEEVEGLSQKYPKIKDVPILVDQMDNVANRKYAAMPERLFGILNGRVEYVGDVGPYGYDLRALQQWIQKLV